ncbi:MAG: hypothetical protein WAZ14_04575 [Patescibacteria group bacterium]
MLSAAEQLEVDLNGLSPEDREIVLMTTLRSSFIVDGTKPDDLVPTSDWDAITTRSEFGI